MFDIAPPSSTWRRDSVTARVGAKMRRDLRNLRVRRPELVENHLRFLSEATSPEHAKRLVGQGREIRSVFRVVATSWGKGVALSLPTHAFYWLAAFSVFFGVNAKTAQADEVAASNASARTSFGDVYGPSPDQGLPVAGWLLYPSFTSGVVFNDNVYATSTRRISALGLRFRPKLGATLDNGIHQIDLDLSADVQTYPGTDSSKAVYLFGGYMVQPSYVTAKASLRHQWKPLTDVTVETAGSFRRAGGASTLLYGDLSGSSSEGVFSAINQNLPYAFYSGLQYYNRFGGGISVEKQIENLWFIRASVGAQSLVYDNLPANNNFQNSTSYYATLRGGYQVTPLLRAYVEAGPSRNIYSRAMSNSIGYHVVGGLESDMIGLFKGEVHAGYQSLTRPNVGQPAAAETFRVQTLAAKFTIIPCLISTYRQVSNRVSAGVPHRPHLVSRSASLAVIRPGKRSPRSNIAFHPTGRPICVADMAKPKWSGGSGAFGGQQRIHVRSLAINLGGSYDFWRNISLTLDYQLTKASGCLALCNSVNVGVLGNPFAFAQADYASGFVQNQIFAGLSYRY